MNNQYQILSWRKLLIWLVLAMAWLVLSWRAYELQVLDRQFLLEEGGSRQQRVVKTSAHRGMIVDRNGEPLAVSTPVDSVWINPQDFLKAGISVNLLAETLSLDSEELKRKILQAAQKEFLYIKRHVSPDVAKAITELDSEGVFLQREYRRYYPTGEVAGHILGFTDIDDKGQEGVELAFDDWLSGESGLKRVVRDRLGQIIEHVENIKVAKPGRNLTLSIDKRLQYVAYRELKSAVSEHNAVSGSVVVLDNKSGEILALVNQPTFNPNNRKELQSKNYRNRAITDVFEPGSTLKPFTMAAALESGYYNARSVIDTRPGFFRVGEYKIKDVKNQGRLDLTNIIRLSSNVGASKIALSLPADTLWKVYNEFGLGNATGIGYPGESSGFLNHYSRWSKIEQATLAYGYGVSTTPLQLAQAYGVIANDGVLKTLNIQHRGIKHKDKRVIKNKTAQQVRAMLRSVVAKGGTGFKANVDGYTIAGKTGTVHKSTVGGYSEDKYVALFAGIAPAINPRLVAVVVINEPRNGDYFGGQVAAPIFSKIMQNALRLMNIPPDDLPALQANHQPELGKHT